MGKLINIDNGGTLTDIWVLDGDQSWHAKTITTPYDLSRCFREGLKKVSEVIYGGEDLETLLHSADHIRYSTTQGTNSLVERKGPRLGLVVDQNFPAADLQRTARAQGLYESIIGPRIESMDTAIEGADYAEQVTLVINRLSAAGANRVVVAFGGDDYLDQESHFRRTCLKLFPRHLLGAVPVSYAGNRSSDPCVTRRAWTSMLNAYLHPAMERFLYNAENGLREFRVRNPLLIYRNDGSAGRVAKTIALKTYSSGPRAGLEAARAYGAYYGLGDLLTMDVGGTTTDLGIVRTGAINVHDRGEVEGIECSFPLSDIISSGIGGGSVIRVDSGSITVGPDSVGSAPGPACFGMGGKQATITDALLLMGLLDPETYFGGQMQLDGDRSRAVIEETIARPLGTNIEGAIHDMFGAWARSIAGAVRDFAGHSSCEIDDDTALLAFGGGGPLGALAVADAADIDKVLVPGLSAVFSAHGIGFSDIAHASEKTIDNHQDLEAALSDLRIRVGRDMFSEGFALDQCETSAWLQVNGATQAIDPQNPVIGEAAGDDIIVGFRAIKSVDRAVLPPNADCEPQPARTQSTRSLLAADGTRIDLPLVKVEDQVPGARGSGPAVMEADYWTCKVESGWRYEFTSNGDVLFEKSPADSEDPDA